MEKKLIRPLNNKVIAGVCGALGYYFEIDPVIVRIVFVIALFVFFPAAFLTYIVLWIAVPQELPSAENKPAGETATPPSVPETKRQSGGGAAVSIFLAVALILAGVLFLVPGSFLWFTDIAAVLVAVFLLFVSFKLVYNMAAGKSYRIVGLSVAFAALTYGVFIILNRFQLFGFGIFVEYTKNLVPAILILVGIGIIFKNVKNKIPEIAIVSALFLFIGIYSGLNGARSPFSLPDGMMRGWRMPHFGQWFRGGNIGTGNFSGSVSLPKGLKTAEYKIESSAGSLNLSAEKTNLHYQGNGMPPTVTTNFENGTFRLDFVNQASETTLWIGSGIPSDMDLRVSAGNLNADLTGMELKGLAVSVNGGAINLKLGSGVKMVSVRNNVGSTDIRLPKNATVRVKVEQSLAHLGMPEEFKYEDGVYVYRGGKKTVDITVNVSMGNVEIGF